VVLFAIKLRLHAVEVSVYATAMIRLLITECCASRLLLSVPATSAAH
jgi:hypothetical protein